jgi:hypothetical protein
MQRSGLRDAGISPQLLVWICLQEEYYGPYFFRELKEQISCVLLVGVIDCVLNTVLEAIQEEFELPTKIYA